MKYVRYVTLDCFSRPLSLQPVIYHFTGKPCWLQHDNLWRFEFNNEKCQNEKVKEIYRIKNYVKAKCQHTRSENVKNKNCSFYFTNNRVLRTIP